MSGLGLLWFLVGAASPAFSGEDLLAPAPDADNWHHEGLSRHAARRAGWTPAAENALAFHTDYVDSYLYSPLWWFRPGDDSVTRLRVAMSSQADLTTLHFDDLFEPAHVRVMWRRYLSGTVCGLVWIARQDMDATAKAAMAHNLVGASLHALQDFSTHSNWIDEPVRRDTTWFEMAPAERSVLPLWTGSYEKPDHLGIKPHGVYEFACSVLNTIGPAGRGLLRMVCHAASPFAGSPLCETVGRCDDTQSIDPPEQVGFVDLPDGVLFIKPGINVDNTWLSPVGAAQRGIDGALPGRQAFDLAYQLAFRTSCQWLHILEHVMEGNGLGAFWSDVKTIGTMDQGYLSDIAPWERLDQIPYRFITSGPYPPVEAPADTGLWYLRLTVSTADVEYAGTNADLVPTVDGVRQSPLDHGPKPAHTVVDNALGFDDHERGSRSTYHLGPLFVPPSMITIRNDAPTTLEVLEAAGRSLRDAVVAFFTGVADFFAGVVGAPADFVGQDHVVLDANRLEGLASGSALAFSLDCDGGSEGAYDVRGWCYATFDTSPSPTGIPWRRYIVRFTELRCRKESEWDRFTTSDEPFVVGVVIPHGSGSPALRWRTGAFADVDTGEVQPINQEFSIWVARRFGFITVATAVYESDDESWVDRERLMHQFADGVTSRTVTTERDFGVVLSEAIAAGWRPQRIEAAAYRRGEDAEVRFYRPFDPNRRVEGGEEISWTLEEIDRAVVPVPDVIDCDCPPDCGTVALPGAIETIEIPVVIIPDLSPAQQAGGAAGGTRPASGHKRRSV